MSVRRAAVVLVLAGLAAGGCTLPSEIAIPPLVVPGAETVTAPVDGEQEAVIESVVDGDTIHVQGVGTVRLIGVDTPETRHPTRGQECFGPEASAHTASLLPAGEPVRLVYDEDPQDPYDRALAYVYRVRDALFVNADLVRAGYARARSYPPNTAHDFELAQLQREARAAGAGLWSVCEQPAPPPPGQGGSCDPAYPDVCLPPPPPDLGCGDTPERYFRALPPDPHHLDGNGDGVACEIAG
jgi:micrococcal nuclease